MMNSLPEILPLFYIEKFKIDNQLSIDPSDIKCLSTAAEKITEEIFISSSSMSKNNFVKIIESSKSPIIKFYNWEFDGK